MKLKTFLLVILLIAALFYLFSERFDVQSSRGEDGQYRVVMVDISNGKIYKIMGD